MHSMHGHVEQALQVSQPVTAPEDVQSLNEVYFCF